VPTAPSEASPLGGELVVHVTSPTQQSSLVGFDVVPSVCAGLPLSTRRKQDETRAVWTSED